MSFLVQDNLAERRFQILIDDALGGFVGYEPRGEVLVLTHTEVDDRFQGRGVGAALVRGALDQIRARGGQVVPRCSFVASFVDRHPEYADLVVDAP
ncbi:GNAT family N-acetyltransferase [Micromonospora sp. DT31]|uniref:GNAT family N-acetyltransferase n=1 Tax=Micromonospora sp. DT31 TaxID=3393434 RepID=UPI003CF6097A